MIIEITGAEDLFSLEASLSKGLKTPAGEDVTVQLARNLRADFFAEPRIVAILSTFAARGPLVIRDWHDKWNQEEIKSQFNESLVGVAATFGAKKVKNMKGVLMPDTRQAMLEQIAIRGGFLEPKEGTARSNSLSLCAFDPDWSEPAALAGKYQSKEAFKTILKRYRQKYFEVGQGVPHTPVSKAADEELGDFIFELFQNTIKHGRLSSDNTTIEGIRAIRLRRHFDFKDRFLARSQGFEELSDYLLKTVPEKGQFKFYEVAVFDCGMGILGRFKNQCPEFRKNHETPEQQITLINRLLTEPLTSTPAFPGAGFGLQRALSAISALDGFVSLRTDSVWMCGHHAQDGPPLDKTGLKSVSRQQEFAPIVGTHFNVLLPVRVN